MSAANATARRRTLTLPGKAPNGAAEAKAVREFKFPDGRPISIHRGAVHFACPANDSPENLTLVGIGNAEVPCRLRIFYASFVKWWKSDETS
jgi:hypothetical protein